MVHAARVACQHPAVDLDLRLLAEDDAPAVQAAVVESLDHLRPWMPWAQQEGTEDGRRAWIRQVSADEDRHYGIWLAGRIVGGCGLHRRAGPEVLEIGYWVHPAFTRRGIATAAVRQLCAEAFRTHGIECVEIHHDRANVASGRVAAAAGFVHVGERPRRPDAPGQEGVELIWRLDRGRYASAAFRAAT